MRRDADHPADDRAAFDHAHPRVHVEGDVDALAEAVAQHVDGAVADDDAREADVDAVELRALHRDAVEDGAADALHGDPVLPADDRHIPNLDVVVRDDDAAADDRPRVSLEHLAPRDHEWPLVDAGAQVDYRGQPVGGEVLVPPGKHVIRFSCDGPPFQAPGDPRAIHFAVLNATFQEEP